MANNTVTVACKLPNGLILRLFDMRDAMEPVMGGPPRHIKEAVAVGEPVYIKGNSTPVGKEVPWEIKHTFALTHNVDAEFWDAWWHQNKDCPWVKNGLIFASMRTADAIAEAKDKQSVKSGFERIVPIDDPRAKVHTAKMN